MEFNLPTINKEETKKAVEAALEKYRILILTIPEEKLPKVTQTFSFLPAGNTNNFHSSTEDAAIKNADFEIEREKYIDRMAWALNKLNLSERSIIYKRYMQQEEEYDYTIYNDLGFSERKYYRIKARAFYKLAFALRIEKYEETVVRGA